MTMSESRLQLDQREAEPSRFLVQSGEVPLVGLGVAKAEILAK
jgi:hypothetical protein